jgi:hypothetical protein
VEERASRVAAVGCHGNDVKAPTELRQWNAGAEKRAHPAAKVSSPPQEASHDRKRFPFGWEQRTSCGTSREAGEDDCVKHMHCSQSSGATYRQRPRTVVEAASNAVPTNDRVKQLFLHLALPVSCVLAKMLQNKMSSSIVSPHE